MRLIAHRGNTKGFDPAGENRITYLSQALDKGYDVEVDVRLMDGLIWLGHDKPLEVVGPQFFRSSRVWTHAKDPATFAYLSRFPDVQCFYQDKDLISMTTNGYLWCNSLHPISDSKAIIFQGRMQQPETGLVMENIPNVFGVYSDWVESFHTWQEGHDLPFDMLVVDIDGVMTNGTKIYGSDGKVSAKCYCDLDFTAIKRFQRAGVKVVFLSGDANVNEAMAMVRKVPLYLNEAGIEKTEVLPVIENDFKIPRERMAYVGDDYYDIGIGSLVGTFFCPSTSPAPVRRAASSVLPVRAGEGVLAAVYDSVEGLLPNVYPVDSPEVNP